MSLNRGSEWNRWDLHIHTPKSIVNNYDGDNPEGWEKFICSLESLPEDVKVLGINDYYFTDGYEKVMEYKFNGRLKNIEKIFLILEFRVDTFATASQHDIQKVNLHILFDIDETDYCNEIQLVKDQFINNIKLSSLEEHNTVPLSKDNMAKYSTDKSISKGFNEFIPSTKLVYDLSKSNTWKEKTFILLGYKEWSNMEVGTQIKHYKRELFDKADAFFTAAPSLEKALEKKAKIEMFGDKPIIHSMDIHDFEAFKADKYDCYTWIKADFSFNGLMQIKYEPLDRIQLKSHNPKFSESKTNIISSICFKNANQWFSNELINLNRGLVAIIGEKGSGKTALLDMIALSSEEGIFEADVKNPSSFYFRVRKDGKLGNLESEITFEGLESYSTKISTLSVSSSSVPSAKVRYLSLKELENYSSEKEQLQSFIREIINSNDTSIKEFYRLYDDIDKEIGVINKTIEENSNKLIVKAEKQKALKSKESELKGHILDEPKHSSGFDEDKNNKFRGLLTKESNLKKVETELQQQLVELESFTNWVEEKIKSTQKKLHEEVQSRANDYDLISELVHDVVKPVVTLNGLDELQMEYVKSKSKITEIQSELQTILLELEPLKKENSNFEDEQKILTNWLNKRNELSREFASLHSEYNRMAHYESSLELGKNDRRSKYLGLLKMKLLQRDKYIELKNVVEEGVIGFNVSISFNFEKLKIKEDQIINHGSGYSSESIMKALWGIYNEITDNLQSTTNDETLDSVLYKLTESLFEVDNLEQFISKNFGKDAVSKLLKQSYTIADFYDFLFDDYYSVNYDIKYNNKALFLLSPGQKGLVLMKLFLKLDKSSKPIIIDQPEDNLDNKSVYNDLKDDIRDVKKRRQIIIATHNPNLVVNTDAEQIIVARFEDVEDDKGVRITYKSGGLEDKEIRNAVCDILEGGKEAFQKREERYHLRE